MKVIFEDLDGRRGEVTEELEVRYSGPWRSVVIDCVERLRTERSDDPDRDPIHAELVVELPEEAPIVEIECVSGSEEGNGT